MILTEWNEEEMRQVPVAPPVRRGRGLASGLRVDLSQRNRTRASATDRPHELTQGATPSVIYAPDVISHGNFLDASYRRILAHPAWANRLTKAHPAKRQARRTGSDEQVRPWCELDAATSSDALLMNIFCFPRVLRGPRLRTLLGVASGDMLTFGYKPRIDLDAAHKDRTEIDMRLGPLLVEAKLTESDFQFAPACLIERYPGFAEVFDPDLLHFTRRGIRSYQLLRGVLIAHQEAALFCVFLDARRPDLIEDWYSVMRAVRSPTLQACLRVLTWQEIAATLPPMLRSFLAEKYGIVAATRSPESPETAPPRRRQRLGDPQILGAGKTSPTRTPAMQ